MQWAPSKNSIFSIEDTYDEADMNAPDVDDDMIESKEGSDLAVSEKAKTCPFINHVFIGQGNNPQLAKDSLINHGYKIMTKGMLFSNEYRLKWTQTSMEINYMQFKEGMQICNHIANANKILTTKIATLETIENLNSKLKNGQLKSFIYSSADQFFPKTFRLDVVSDLISFLNLEDQGLWIQKKS